MPPESLPDIHIEQLSVPQRLELMGLLWDSIPDCDLPTPDWHRRELKRRVMAADGSPEATVPWEQVRAQLREKP